jgi:hypothetical protein
MRVNSVDLFYVLVDLTQHAQISFSWRFLHLIFISNFNMYSRKKIKNKKILYFLGAIYEIIIKFYILLLLLHKIKAIYYKTMMILEI